MSTKPFLAVNIVDGELGVIHERDTFEEAVDIATEIVAEQCDADKNQIRAELTEDSNFVASDGSFRTYIAQAEDR